MRFLISILLAAFLCHSCKEEEKEIPQDILSPQQLIPVLADVHLAEAAATLKSPGGDLTNQYAKSHDEFIFSIHGITRDKFERSLEYYAKDPKVFDGIYTEVINELSRKQAEAENLKR